MQDSKVKVCIDPGHGGKDSGATGLVIEKDINLQVAKEIEKHMNEYDLVDIIFTRTEDKYITLKERCQIANKSDCDFFVSLHCNSSLLAPKSSGIEVYHYLNSKRGSYLAYHILSAVLKNLPFLNNRGVKKANFYVLRHTKMPACLVEMGFVNAKEDVEILTKYQDVFAKSIVEGIINMYTADTHYEQDS